MTAPTRPARTAKFRPRDGEGPGAAHILPSTLDRMRRDAIALSPEAYRARYGDSIVARMTWRETVAQPVDRPFTGLVAVDPQDERERVRDKPIALADFRGPVPRFYIGGGQEHLGNLADLADEDQHYDAGAAVLAARTRPDYRAAITVFEDAVARRVAGKKTYGATTT